MKIKILMLCLVVLGSISLSSCKKKCKFDKDDTHSGDIVSDVIIYQKSNFGDQKVVIRGGSTYAEEFELSFDGGITRVPVDYTKYNLMNFPTTTKCDAVFVRDVDISDVNDIVRYTISYEDCDNCASTITIDNFVVVPAFPVSYDVQYELN